MGKNKNCVPSTRKVIISLLNKNWSIRKVADHLNCSKSMVFQASQHFKKYNTTENIPRRRRPRKTTKKPTLA